MRVRFHTLSAAVYVIDTVAMTWERLAPNPRTPEFVLGLTASNGKLSDEPIIRIGRRCILPIWEESAPGYERANTIHTTEVQRIELIEP